MAGLLYRLCACATIVVSLLLVAAIWRLGNNSMIACGFMGALFIFLAARPAPSELLAAATAATGSVLCYWAVRGTFGHTLVPIFTGIGAFLGLGCLMVMACGAVWSGSRAHIRPLQDALILPVFSLLAGIAMGIVNGKPQSSYDYFLYDFDAALRISPGYTVGLLFRAEPWVRATSAFVYAVLLTFPPAYHAWAARRGARSGINWMHAFAIAGVCGFVFYQICPAEGPLAAFRPNFPDHLPQTVPLQVYPTLNVHNAMPSMHMTWALLVWWCAWEIGSTAVGIASVFVGFTFLATLGFGEHYFIDLVASAPLAIAVICLCAKRYGRAIAGLGLLFAWLLVWRSGIALHLPAVVNWTLIAATLALSAAIGAITLRGQIRRPERASVSSMRPLAPAAF